ncbi:MAG: hypothetical protein MI747_25610 [Desulfobacterales bacterium]|nr:hypothetical protein [Desulfobacterales bacterium]
MKHNDAVIELTELMETDLEISDSGEADILELTEVVPEQVETRQSQAAPSDLNGLDISEEQVMAALERYIEKRFSDQIETALLEIMEKVISKEITEIRENLQRDLDQIGKH